MSLSREWIPPHSETNGLGTLHGETSVRKAHRPDPHSATYFILYYIIITYAIVFVLHRI